MIHSPKKKNILKNGALVKIYNCMGQDSFALLSDDLLLLIFNKLDTIQLCYIALVSMEISCRTLFFETRSRFVVGGTAS